MSHDHPRRRFLQTVSALGLGTGLAGLGGKNVAEARSPRVTPEAVRFRPEIEPVVRWIEETPRDRIFERAGRELQAGLSERDFLAGLFLAGIRNVKPRPVGFKFHAVLVMNAAHQLSLTARPEDRLLPLFWALDNFKASQAQDVKEGDWVLEKLDEARVPSPTKARAAFEQAMDAWDSEAADVAIAGLCRSAGAGETTEILLRYAIRDQRNIGHKPIFVAQSRRLLEAIGWEHAEPVLRSVVYGLLDLQGDSRPVAVGPYDSNVALAKSIREGWSVGKPDPDATRNLLDLLRSADSEKSAAEAAALLGRGVSPGSIWGAVMLAGSELLVQSPGIIALHSMTAANALHSLYRTAADDSTRKLALLQAVGWLPLYRDRIKPKSDFRIDRATQEAPNETGLDAVFDLAARDRLAGVRAASALLEKQDLSADFFAVLRRLILTKGRDSHDYKYGIAAFEEAMLVEDPKSRASIAAAATIQLPTVSAADNPLTKKAREVISAI
ncbi:MAG: hypothetical protein SFX72_06755 [Isosphaeraceae bacterium]|nr:hypothetical protein [Isosphaeraceae bacterium]